MCFSLYLICIFIHKHRENKDGHVQAENGIKTVSILSNGDTIEYTDQEFWKFLIT